MRGCTLEARWGIAAVTSVVQEERAAGCVTRPGSVCGECSDAELGSPKFPPPPPSPAPGPRKDAKVSKRETAGT